MLRKMVGQTLTSWSKLTIGTLAEPMTKNRAPSTTHPSHEHCLAQVGVNKGPAFSPIQQSIRKYTDQKDKREVRIYMVDQISANA